MVKCYSCEKKTNTYKKFYDLKFCDKCHSKFGLSKIQNIKAPNDKYLKSLVLKDDKWYVNALNQFSSTVPKKEAYHLLGVCISQCDNEEMDGFFIHSSVIAARSVLLFGTDKSSKRELDADIIHFLINLANLIHISIIAKHGEYYGNLNLDIDDSEIIDDINIETTLTIIDILNEIRKNDNGELRELILDMFYILKEY